VRGLEDGLRGHVVDWYKEEYEWGSKKNARTKSGRGERKTACHRAYSEETHSNHIRLNGR